VTAYALERFRAGLGHLKAARREGLRGADAEQHLLDARAALATAMNHAEGADDALFAKTHQALDETGRLMRTHFPRRCRIPFRDGAYFRECPVELGHLRVGMSIEADVERVRCSVCDGDLLDEDGCPHIEGRTCDGVECFGIVESADIKAVALVGRPDFPDARFTSIGYDVDYLTRQAGREFTPGTSLLCNECLSPCTGLNEFFRDASH